MRHSKTNPAIGSCLIEIFFAASVSFFLILPFLSWVGQKFCRSWVGIKVGSKGPQLGDGNMGADISQESRNTLEINHLVSVAFDNVNSNTAQ